LTEGLFLVSLVDQTSENIICPLQAIAAGATAATRCYTSFLNSFRKEDTKKLPDRIDEVNEHFFLMAAFSLGRVLHRCAIRVDKNTSDR
jgi:hypothetical protein